MYIYNLLCRSNSERKKKYAYFNIVMLNIRRNYCNEWPRSVLRSNNTNWKWYSNDVAINYITVYLSTPYLWTDRLLYDKNLGTGTIRVENHCVVLLPEVHMRLILVIDFVVNDVSVNWRERFSLNWFLTKMLSWNLKKKL